MSCAQIVVATGDAEFRSLLIGVLKVDASVVVVGEASNGFELLSLEQRLRPDLLLLDSGLADRTNHAASSWSSIRTILLVDTLDQKRVVQALRLAARGIVPYKSSRRVLAESIRTVLADKYWLNSAGIAILVGMAQELLVDPSQQSWDGYPGLTERELHIVNMISTGRSNRQIGQELAISERTVKHHLTRIFAKLGISSRLQLANFAVTHRLRASTHSSQSSVFGTPELPDHTEDRPAKVAAIR